MTLEQFESRSGHAKVSTGGRIRIDSALLLADEACIAWAVQDAKGAVLDLGRTQRLASRAQILALIARDGGCIFPGCTAPPEWTERHHILEWLFGGKTDLCNLVLLCKYHHRRHLKAGWRIVMVDGIPWWIPPKEIDPQQTPIRNRR